MEAFKDPKNFELITTEVFGPFQVMTEYAGQDNISTNICCLRSALIGLASLNYMRVMTIACS